MSNRKLPYREGDWFAVPLRDGGYAIGIVARMRKSGKALFGYFFGPKRKNLPTKEDVEQYNKDNSILIGMFGDLGLYNGEWKVISHSEQWDGSKWPMPPFVRVDSINNKIAYKTWYSEGDPSLIIKEVRCDPKEAEQFPEDAMMGSGAVEIRLTKLLSKHKISVKNQ